MFDPVEWLTGFYAFHDALSPTPEAGVSELDELDDVNAPSPASGEFLGYTGEEWTSLPIAAGSSELDELDDVNVTTPASGDFLQYNGTDWENSIIAPPHTDANGAYAQLGNICFGAGDPPDASTVPAGTIFIQYTIP